MSALLQPLAEQYEDRDQQRDAGTLGMWIFLATELMFFGPLFFSYLYGRVHEAAAFAEASRHTHIVLGTANTALLLVSSTCMALAVRAVRVDAPRQAFALLLATAAMGAAFLGVKGVEYAQEWQEGLVPGLRFLESGPLSGGMQFFFVDYFVMTLLHALHLLIGIVLVVVMAGLVRSGRFSSRYFTPLEVSGLYWHFVDIMWIFLYPLLYLVGRSG
jgi:cytochrome c oxidase subunit 3